MSLLNRSATRLLSAKCKPSTTDLFLRLPASYRAFHASPKPQFVDGLVSGTHEILSGIHSISGLPWAYTIPLAALGVRAVLILPLTLYTRRRLQRQASLNPLLHAWMYHIRAKNMQTSATMGPKMVESISKKEFRTKQRELFSRWGCQTWKQYLPMLQIPVWVVISDTIRKMSGHSEGLLSFLASLLPKGWTSNVDAAPNATLATMTDGQVGLVPVSSVGIEPGFATEGMLWFPDLLSSDPMLLMPFILSGVMLWNIKPWKFTNSKQPWRRGFTKGLGLLSLMVIPVTLQVPSALLLYWISSASLGGLQAALLDKFMPIKAPVQPCQPKDATPQPQQ
jgi:inner membrane protein COX18